MPFIRYEQQRYADDVNKVLNKTFYQAGLGWYPYVSNFNIKAGVTRKDFPNDPNDGLDVPVHGPGPGLLLLIPLRAAPRGALRPA